MKILLDYVFEVTAITPTPAASTAFLRQVCIVVAPKMGVTPGEIVECNSMSEVAAVTDNTEAQQLFNAGMSKVYVLPVNDLYLADFLEGIGDFYTILISSDFDDADIIATQASGNITITSYANLVSGTPDVVSVAGQAFTAQAGAATLGTATFQAATSNNATAASLAAQINAHAATKNFVTAVANNAVVTITAKAEGSGGNSVALGYTDNDTNVGATKSGTALSGGEGLYLGEFKGVVGISSDDDDFLDDQAVITNRAAFHSTDTTLAKNMFYAFGKLLSTASKWLNQQYIEMPYADDVDTLGMAKSLFDDKISFVISDDEYGKRLGLLAAGSKAIVAPYIIKNLTIDLQSKALQWFSANMPDYTKTQAALLEDELQSKVIEQKYIATGQLSGGKIQISLVNDNFVATGDIEIPEPKAMWRVENLMTQTS